VSAPAERRETGEARADEERRARILLATLSPLVHRLNNSLAVVQGVHELGEQAREPEREMVRRELSLLGQALARVALLARPPAARRDPLLVQDVLRTHELLLAPLAEKLGVELELRADGTAVAEVDARLEQLLLAASTALLTSCPRVPRARLRLLARAESSGLVLVLGATGPARSSPDLTALEALARALGRRARMRATRGACALRVTLGVRAIVQTAPVTASARGARRILLLHAADAERELVSTLLREHGWTVDARADLPQAGTFDLALVERRLALADPSLPARVQARFALARVELLEPRMRPGALLALLGA